MVVVDSSISVSVHPKAGDGIELCGFESDQGVSGFVAVRVPPGVSLWCYTVADLDALIAAAVEARTWLEANFGRPVFAAAQPAGESVSDRCGAGGGGVMRTHSPAERLAVLSGLRCWAQGVSATKPPSNCWRPAATAGTSALASSG